MRFHPGGVSASWSTLLLRAGGRFQTHHLNCGAISRFQAEDELVSMQELMGLSTMESRREEQGVPFLNVSWRWGHGVGGPLLATDDSSLSSGGSSDSRKTPPSRRSDI